MTPRWDYGDEVGGWQERTLFLGGTNHFDIYVDFEGNLRLTCGPMCNDMSAAEREVLGHALTFVQCFFPTPERWALNEMAKANTE